MSDPIPQGIDVDTGHGTTGFAEANTRGRK